MIEKLLVANRGEIARRIIRSARAMGIACVAVHSDPDASAPHVAESDEAVRLPGESAAETYLRVDAIVGAATKSGAQAVHPGYGFLSENAALARACESAGIVFVGPPPEVIEAMGSKVAAKATMSAAGVPVLPTVEVPPGARTGPRSGPRRAEGQGPATSQVAELEKAAAGLGWPVLVKASAGGGGRGMRIVERPGELAEALASAEREARGAFGDGTLFLEPYVARPRHVEVQILADSFGTVVHLFERECSIQRRHQKIIEEAPAPSVGPVLRAALGDAALRAARAIGYVNAGTVEFLLLQDGTFAFLEMNTRLQVEHTVTECVTGFDLVRLQLLVAEGARLPPEVLEARLRGHAIEARLYAEDPTASWRPSSGRLHRFSVPVAPRTELPGALADEDTGEPYGPQGVGIRVDSAVEDGSEVTVHYDPLLAKVIAYAPTRREAARALGRALERTQVHGLHTNQDLLVRILRHREFLEGDIDTAFLERHDPAELGAPRASADAVHLHALAAALAAQAQRRAAAPVLGTLPSGWRNVEGPPQRCSFEGPQGTTEIGYRFGRTGRLGFIEIDGKRRDDVELLECTADDVVLSLEGLERHYEVQRVGNDAYVDGPDGSSALRAVDRFPLPGSTIAPGALVAPLPGTVVKVAAEVGALVDAGDVLVAIEAMKMEHEIRTHIDGEVRDVLVATGEQVEAGTVLAIVEPSS